MSNKTAVVNGEMIEQLESLVAVLKREHLELSRAHKKSFKDGIANVFAYSEALDNVKTLAGELFDGIDIVDPEDFEFQRREEEAAGEEDEESEDGEDGENGEEPNDAN